MLRYPRPSDRVHTASQGMKPPVRDPVLDRLGVEPEIDELRMRHDPVLALR
jgi:hypothetical protein